MNGGVKRGCIECGGAGLICIGCNRRLRDEEHQEQERRIYRAVGGHRWSLVSDPPAASRRALTTEQVCTGDQGRPVAVRSGSSYRPNNAPSLVAHLVIAVADAIGRLSCQKWIVVAVAR